MNSFLAGFSFQVTFETTVYSDDVKGKETTLFSAIVKQGSYNRNDASHFVAKKHGVAPQTVQDKYGRQLSLTANQFDRLLIPQRSNDLISLLVKKFPQHGEVIRKVVQA